MTKHTIIDFNHFAYNNIFEINEYGSYAIQSIQVDDFDFKNSIKYRRFLYRTTWNNCIFESIIFKRAWYHS